VRPERNLIWLARIARVLTAPFVRYDIRGGACATELSVDIIAVNHRSMFDVVAGLVCLHHFGHHPRLLIERKYVEGKWTAPFAQAIGAIPVDRIKGGGTSVEAALAALRDGIPIVMLPEGKLHHDPHDPRSIGPTRTGLSRLAVGGQVPVVAAALGGTADVMPAHARLPRLNPFRRKHVTCNVADEPIWLTGDDHRANTDRVMAAVQRLLILPSET
jgi:1-acyl-sn-glycerol-3-phosphate acyltransferase